jgi:hypothetical protein
MRDCIVDLNSVVMESPQERLSSSIHVERKGGNNSLKSLTNGLFLLRCDRNIFISRPSDHDQRAVASDVEFRFRPGRRSGGRIMLQ